MRKYKFHIKAKKRHRSGAIRFIVMKDLFVVVVYQVVDVVLEQL